MLLQLRPEFLDRLPRGLRVGTGPLAWWEFHIVVRTHRRERGVKVVGTGPRFQKRHHVRIAGTAGTGDEVPPGALAELEVLHLVQLGEAWRHTGFHGSLAQQSRAKRVDRAGEEALEIRERMLNAFDACRIGGA